MDINKELENAKARMEAATDEYNRIKKRQEILNSLPEKYRLAEIIHSRTCHFNHIDQCAFDYENWTNNIGHSRTPYLKKAENILKKVKIEIAIEVIENL